MKKQLENLSVYYENYGSGYPIIMIHGFGPDHNLMKGCMEPVFQKKNGWKRIYFDLPGMGKTSATDWIVNSDQMLQIVLNFIDNVIPDQHFILAGESYGGYLARGIIANKFSQVDGLLLICPLIIAESDQRKLPDPTIISKDTVFLSTIKTEDREKFESFAVIQNEQIWKRTRTEVMPGLNAADEDFLYRLQTYGYPFSFDVDSLIPPFEKPTLILTGRQDAIVGYRDSWDILEKYPRATFAVLDSAGHNLQIEQEHLFNTLVSEWLDRIEEQLSS